MNRYNSNYGSHDQLQELRKLGMEISRERDELKKRVEQLEDELVLALEALVRYRNPVETVNWQNIAKMMSHFDVCTSARSECNICHEARQAYIVALTA